MSGEFLEKFREAAKRDLESGTKVSICNLLLDCWSELITLVEVADRVAMRFPVLDDLRDVLDALDTKASKL